LLLCIVLLLASAAGRQKNQTDFGLLYPSSPRRSGRSPHRPLIFLAAETTAHLQAPAWFPIWGPVL